MDFTQSYKRHNWASIRDRNCLWKRTLLSPENKCISWGLCKQIITNTPQTAPCRRLCSFCRTERCFLAELYREKTLTKWLSAVTSHSAIASRAECETSHILCHLFFECLKEYAQLYSVWNKQSIAKKFLTGNSSHADLSSAAQDCFVVIFHSDSRGSSNLFLPSCVRQIKIKRTQVPTL